MVKVRVVCRGTSPLLMQRLHEEGEGYLKLLNVSSQAEERSPEQEASANIYRHHGNIVLPSHCFRFCLRCAAEKLEAVRPSRHRSWSERFARGVTIEEQFLSMSAKESDWTSHYSKVTNALEKQTHVVVFPQFTHWHFAVTLRIEERYIAEEDVRELIDYAGRRIGLGAKRPYHKGMFGQFEVVGWRRIA